VTAICHFSLVVIERAKLAFVQPEQVQNRAKASILAAASPRKAMKWKIKRAFWDIEARPIWGSFLLAWGCAAASI
jgi:hypothetical protein